MNILSIFLKYVPVVFQTVMAVEMSIPHAPGTTKKDMVIAAVSAGAKAASQFDESHVAAIGTIIDATVAAANKTGLFTSKPVVAK